MRFAAGGNSPSISVTCSLNLRAEMQEVQGLIFAIAEVKLHSPLAPLTSLGDVSLWGFALGLTTSFSSEVVAAAVFREKCRFRETDAETHLVNAAAPL